MPLLDHFHPPLAPLRQWGSVHSTWANAITQQLNAEVLPADYVAQPRTQIGNLCEIDVGTLKASAGGTNGTTNGAAGWAPPPPARSLPFTFRPAETFEVQVFQELGGVELRAAIELVSPANKDRPATREAFALKCASYLLGGVSVVVVDVVTERLANLHEELLGLLEMTSEPPWRSPTNLYAVAYRVVLSGGRRQMDLWSEPLALGDRLPTMPLWLAADLCVPLRLDESYAAACATLRIRG